jgi:hypothetical protein
MKLIKTLLSKLSSPIALALAGAALCSALTQAAKIEYYVSLGPKYGNKYVLIVPGSNTGGRVVWSNPHGWWITDRASRGESVDAWFTANTKAERTNSRISKCWLSSTGGNANLRLWGSNMLTATTFTVPTSPFWDNIYVNVNTASGTFSMRLPAGSRP